MVAMLKRLVISLFLSCFSWYLIWVPSPPSSHEFLQCLSENIPSEFVYEQSSSKFADVLVSSIRNPRFLTNTTVIRPLCIVTPTHACHVQAAVLCGRRHGVRLRVRSGGHDYEGLSYRSTWPDEVFGVVDLANLRSISVNLRSIGELYYAIAKNDSRVAFPAGEWATVGVGGHFSGGGIGMLMRKYGLSVDNVLDAQLVNADGDLLDRAGMGEELFWAIRGGGGGSFGIVLSWTIQLVQVPPSVTVFSIGRKLDQGAVDILTRWQNVAPSLPGELTIRVKVRGQEALFLAMYLGTCSSLVSTMGRQFPELNMASTDCRSMTWLESTALSFSDLHNIGTPEEVLLNRTSTLSVSVKGKSDYVRRPISKGAWEDIFSWFRMNGSTTGYIMLEPHGGFMDSVLAAATPYPHRSGVLYIIQYLVLWPVASDGTAETTWLASFYDFMGQHVSKNPREAYVNFRDLDIGQNVVVDDGMEGGEVWGERYFMDNYRRLAAVKVAVDPTDYFRNEQSIPPLLQRRKTRQFTSMN